MISVATEIAYGEAWKKLLEKERRTPPKTVSGESKHGRPSLWSDYKRLLMERGELTAADFAHLMGKDYDTTVRSLRRYWEEGWLLKSRVQGVILWRLPSEQTTSERLSDALSEAKQ